MGLKPVEHMSLTFFLEQPVIREGAQVLREQIPRSGTICAKGSIRECLSPGKRDFKDACLGLGS